MQRESERNIKPRRKAAVQRDANALLKGKKIERAGHKNGLALSIYHSHSQGLLAGPHVSHGGEGGLAHLRGVIPYPRNYFTFAGMGIPSGEHSFEAHCLLLA